MTGAASFTPGPWLVSETRYHRDGRDWRNIHTEDGAVIAVVPAEHWRAASAPDANLIAAAPTMFAALEEIASQKLECEMDLEAVRSADWQTGYEACVTAARAALSRAKGQG